MKIIFSDFDNTLHFRHDEAKTRANIEALEKWKKAGNLFCISTGRSYKSVTEEFPKIKELCDYYIVDSGSIITDKSGKILRAFYFEPELIAEIIEFSKTLSEVPKPYYYTPSSEGVEYRTKNVTKLRLWFKDLEFMERAESQIKKRFQVSAIGIPAKSSYAMELEDKEGFIEIIPPSSNKGNAVKTLCQIKGISVENILTIGDDLNDYEMVRDFNGYAIEGARLAETYVGLKTVPSLAQLVAEILTK